MLKYLTALVVIFGLAFVVARQDQHAADQAAQKTAEPHKAAASTNPNEQHPQENIEYPSGDSPRWYVLCLYSLFRWPNGTTTWAIILTLMAIAEQTRETAKATRAVEKNITLQFRPRLEVRVIVLTPGVFVPITGIGQEVSDWNIEYAVVNVGGTPAHVMESNLTIIVREGDLPAFPPYSNGRDSFGSFNVQPGEQPQRSMTLTSNEDIWRFVMVRKLIEAGGGVGNIYCVGFLQYRDDIGTSRRTAFYRYYNAQTQQFERIDKPPGHYEYTD